MNQLLNQNLWVISQIIEWGEAILGFEGANKYSIQDEDGYQIGFVAEESTGFFSFLLRFFLRSRRPFRASVLDVSGQVCLSLYRPFYWFFSSMYVTDGEDQEIGSIHKRFTILTKKYDLRTSDGSTFAQINTWFFKIWTFEIWDSNGGQVGVITKRWGGILKEVFTDSDRYLAQVDPELEWGDTERAIILAAAITIDFDYFEENSSNNRGFFGMG
jgi:uncharacterized protein YxjI